ncbi:MAG TPA: tripartite tricarboxylate transporter substrate-binding protein [Eoetvoesiella sp.]
MKKTLFTALFVAIASFSGSAIADSYPSKPVKVIVPFAPGGGIDVLIRAVGAELGQRWGQAVVVENKPGAGSLIGASMAANAPADGYTLLATVNQTLVGNRFLYKELPYDPDKSFDPITMMVKADQLIIASADLPAKSLKEVVDMQRRKPGSLTYGSFGNGSQPHLLFETINKNESLDLLHIPYKGITPMLTALAGGQVKLGTGSVAVAAPLIAAGKIKPISVAGDSRVAQFPDVPTTTEEGFPYVKTSIWYGLFAPAGTPKHIVDKIRTDVQAVLRNPTFAEQFAVSKGLTVIAGDADQLRTTIKQETVATGAMVKAAGVVAE